MLFKVTMHVYIPEDLPKEVIQPILDAEKNYSKELQKSGKWRHIWRIVGQYANISIFDVASNEELHQILTNLPLYPYMEIEIEALCRHPSAIRSDDR